MDELKRRALDGGSAHTRQHKSLTNAVLRDTLQQQLNNFADAQVLFSEYGVRVTDHLICAAKLQVS